MSGRTQDGDRPRRPRKLTPHEQRVLWSENGDVDSLWGVLAAARWDMIVDLEAVFSMLLRAITVRAERDPAGFAAETFTRMVGFNTYLLMRSQMYINLRLGQHGRSTRSLGRPDFSLSSVAELIPGLLELQGALAETMAAEATTARAHELARAKRIENDRAEGLKAGARRPAPRAHAAANGAAGAMGGGSRALQPRPAGLLDGSGSNTSRAARTITTTTSCSRSAPTWNVAGRPLRAKLEAHADDPGHAGRARCRGSHRAAKSGGCGSSSGRGGRRGRIEPSTSAATRCPNCSSGPGPCWRNTGSRSGGLRKFKAMLGWPLAMEVSSGACWPPGEGQHPVDHRRRHPRGPD